MWLFTPVLTQQQLNWTTEARIWMSINTPLFYVDTKC